MLLEEITEVQKPEVVCEDSQGAIFLAKNRQVGMRAKNIDICHTFMRDMIEKKTWKLSILGVKKTLRIL